MRRELLPDRGVESLGFLEVRDRGGELAPTHADPTAVGQHASKVKRVLLPPQPGDGACQQAQGLVDPARIAAQCRPLELGDPAKLLRAEPVDLVEVRERRWPTPGDRQHSGNGEVRIGRQLVVAGLLGRRDGLVERLLGEVDLAEHP